MLSRAPAAFSLTPAACWSKASTGPAVAALGAQAESKPPPSQRRMGEVSCIAAAACRFVRYAALGAQAEGKLRELDARMATLIINM